MDNQVVPIKITYSNLNNINIYLSFILLFIGIIVAIKIYSKISLKTNKRVFIFTDDITSLFMDSKSSFTEMIIKIMNKSIQSKVNSINSTLDFESSAVDEIKNEIKNIDLANYSENDIKQATDFQNLYMKTITDVDKLKSTIKKINDTHLANVESMKEIYKNYYERITDYVNGLVNIMKSLQYQINVAYITPALTSTITPITGIYNYVYEGIMKNASFIKKYTKDFDFSDVVPLKQGIKQELDISFEKSKDIFMKLNY